MEDKKCLWCLKKEPEVTFKNRAHIFPQSLGAKKIFPLECDGCNAYFGNYNNSKPSLDLVLKEAFNLSRYMLLSVRNNDVPKFKSEYFKADHRKGIWGIKQQFKIRKNFQDSLGIQLKKGLIKVALETLYLNSGLGYENKYDRYRDFVRNDSSECQVLYLKRNVGAVLTADKFLRNPQVLLSKDWEIVLNRFGCLEFELLTHQFILPLINTVPKDYSTNERERHESLFLPPIELKYFTDIDFSLSIFRD